ncbi:MAG: hypothetical protein HY319_03405 [Armatimonadetes bacterium]|nr:hypothetical protein [Armatimonadota bacterium]
MSDRRDNQRRIELPERGSRRREGAKGARKPPKLELQLEGRSLPLTSTGSPPRVPPEAPPPATDDKPGPAAVPPPNATPEPAAVSPKPAAATPPPQTGTAPSRVRPSEADREGPIDELVPSHMQREFYRSSEAAPPPKAEEAPIDIGTPTLVVEELDEKPKSGSRWLFVALLAVFVLLAGQRLAGPGSPTEVPPEPVPLSEIVPTGQPALQKVDAIAPAAAAPAPEDPEAVPEGFSEAADPMPSVAGEEKPAGIGPLPPGGDDDVVVGDLGPDAAPAAPGPPHAAAGTGLPSGPESLEQPPNPMAGIETEEVIVVEDTTEELEPQGPVPVAAASPPVPVEKPAGPSAPPADQATLEVLVKVVPENARVLLLSGDQRYEHSGPGPALLKPHKPGAYTLKVSAPGYEVFQKTLKVEGQHNLAVHLEPAPELVAPPPVYSAPPPSYDYSPPPVYNPPPSSGGGRYDISAPSY